MAKRDMRHENLRSLTMLSGQYRKTQTREAYDYNQALLDEQFETLGNVYEIEEESIKGSNLYSPILASVSTVESIRTKNYAVDDFRNLLFRDIKHDTWIGKRYRFGDNVWLTINVATINTIINNTLVQRCNNVVRWIDEETGEIYSEPCVVGEKASMVRTEQGAHIQVIDGQLSLIMQYNNISKNIKINHRIKLGSRTFVVKLVNDWERQSTFKNDVGLLTLELDVVNTNESIDNVDKILERAQEESNKVLNGNIVLPEQRDLTCFPPYDIGTFDVYNYIEGIKQSHEFQFNFFDAPPDSYEVLNVSGNSFTIKALKYSKVPLTIEYTNTTTSETQEIQIELRGVL